MTESVRRFESLSEEEKAGRRGEVRVLVLTGLGLNCEAETAAAFRLAGARVAVQGYGAVGRWTARVIEVRGVGPGDAVGYGGTWKNEGDHPAQVAVLAVGYVLFN